ncbi:MAG TPA: hypothetical protein VGK84_02355 [Candidatus Tumulicola sp.]|jgi:hypothetical protein
MAVAIDPYAIYAQAQAYWLAQRYPQQLQYRVVVRILEAGKERVERYESRYDASSDAIDVNPVSDYERDNPVRPSGLNIGILGYRIGKPLPQVDFLGVPVLAPTYTFGMASFVPAPEPTPFNSEALVNEIRREYNDPNPRVTPTPTPPAEPPVIAVVVAAHRNYAITFAGAETIAGHPCYHLRLRAVRDPGKYRLRDLWIDQGTTATWRLAVGSNFLTGPGTKIPWTVDFVEINGVQYIDQETAAVPMSVAGEIYTQTVVGFENVRPLEDNAIPMPPQFQWHDVLQEPVAMPTPSPDR